MMGIKRDRSAQERHVKRNEQGVEERFDRDKMIRGGDQRHIHKQGRY